MLGIWVGKLVSLALRLRGRKATSLPGKLALRLSPRLIEKLGHQLRQCIVVTGTNGKTTTTSLLAGILRQEDEWITNAEGANLAQGLATVLLQNATWYGRLRTKNALFEIDEATLPLVAEAFPIRATVVTNVFRDQLDRYGELDTTLHKIQAGIAKTDGIVILNGDDPLARHIGLHTSNTVYYFGMSRESIRPTQRAQMRDGAFCLECGHALVYEGFIYGQLGLYQCPNCDFFRPHPDFIGQYDGANLTLDQTNLPQVSFPLPVRGLFNVYNSLAAITTARVFGLPLAPILLGLSMFQAPTGRMQVFSTAPPVVLNLIKNPTGCDSVLQAICAEPGAKVLCVAINDLAADGRDVSWLWDADFELVPDEGQIARCITSGYRAEDMAVRLKYAGLDMKRVDVMPNIDEAIERTIELAASLGNIPVYIVTTYTLLHHTADYLEKKANQRVKTAENCASVS